MKLLRTLLIALTTTLVAQARPIAAPIQDGTLVFTDEVPPPGIPAPPATGQAMVAPYTYVAHLPEAQTAGAPTWIKPGTRFTIWVGSASFRGSAGQTMLVEDPNGSETGKDGKKYRKVRLDGGSVDQAGWGPGTGAGAGYMQIDITSVSPTEVIYDMRSFNGDGQVSQPNLASVTSNVVHPGSCEFWINPKLLQQLQVGEMGGFQVLRGAWEVQGKNYNAILFKDSLGHAVYDLDTGMYLGASLKMRSASTHKTWDKTAQDVGRGTSNNTTMTETYPVGLRQLDLPWAADGIEAQIQSFKGGAFQGALTSEPNHGAPGLPISVDIQVTARGNSWVEALVTSTMNGGRNAAKRYSTATQIGGLCMNPKSLANLRKGQVIDQDPITGYRTFVEHVGPNQQGARVIGIVEQGPGGLVRWVYSAQSGELIGSSLVSPLPDGSGATVTYLDRVR